VLVGDEDYMRKYPPDEYGDEMNQEARIWKTHIDERDIADKEYISVQHSRISQLGSDNDSEDEVSISMRATKQKTTLMFGTSSRLALILIIQRWHLKLENT